MGANMSWAPLNLGLFREQLGDWLAEGPSGARENAWVWRARARSITPGLLPQLNAYAGTSLCDWIEAR